jgi:hypothetical protein
MTYKICQDQNIPCYKLPIETYMEHSTTGGTFNQILSINQGEINMHVIIHILSSNFSIRYFTYIYDNK